MKKLYAVTAMAVLLWCASGTAMAAPPKCSLPGYKQCQSRADCNDASMCVSFDNPCAQPAATIQFCLSKDMAGEGLCDLVDKKDNGNYRVMCKQPPPVE